VPAIPTVTPTAGIPSPSPTFLVDAFVGTDGSTFDHGERLDVLFEVNPALMGDWVGIFPTGTPYTGQSDSAIASRSEALLWLNTCGTQDDCPSEEQMSGVVQFGSGGESGQLDWPLPSGDYTAILLRDEGSPITLSAPFSVLQDDMTCEDDEDAIFWVWFLPRDCCWLRQKYTKRVLEGDHCDREDVRSACPYTCGECLPTCEDDSNRSCDFIWEEHPDDTEPFCGGEHDPAGNNILYCPRACKACPEDG